MTIESHDATASYRGVTARHASHPVGHGAAGLPLDGNDFSGLMGMLFAPDASLPVSEGADAVGDTPQTADPLMLAPAGVLDAPVPASSLIGSLVAQIGDRSQALTPVPTTMEAPNDGLPVGPLGLEAGEEKLESIVATALQSGGVAKGSGVAVRPAEMAVQLLPPDQIKPAVPTDPLVSSGAPLDSDPQAPAVTDPPVPGARAARAALLVANDAAALVRHEMRSVLPPEGMAVRAEADPAAMTAAPLTDNPLPLGRGRGDANALAGLSMGTQQVLERLGLSAGQQVAQTQAVVADTQIAETVSYWVTQGIQNAELTLEGVADEPVAVHIELSGDQTRVEFRSDQPQVRQALEAATAQLKSLLLSQGLELSGVSVGSFGAGEQPPGERAPRPAGQRVAGIALVDAVETRPARVLSSGIGHSLDLYV